jgi:hypothetical protein
MRGEAPACTAVITRGVRKTRSVIVIVFVFGFVGRTRVRF